MRTTTSPRLRKRGEGKLGGAGTRALFELTSRRATPTTISTAMAAVRTQAARHAAHQNVRLVGAGEMPNRVTSSDASTLKRLDVAARGAWSVLRRRSRSTTP